MLKNQKYGVEIELTGITRAKAAQVIADFFEAAIPTHIRDAYDAYTITDNKGRSWKVMRDTSITAEPYGDEYKVEIVSPILVYEDIETIQKVLRKLRENGAKANSSCGIHIHIDGVNHIAKSLKNIVNFMCSRQDLLIEALNVHPARLHYCKKMCLGLLKKIKSLPSLDIASFQSTWYSRVNHDYTAGVSHSHYNETRYQCLNLHSFFYRGTVEFRMFNSTTHAGELKSYIQLCLAVSAWAIESTDRILFKGIQNYINEQKLTIMNNVLTNRLGMTGQEFKTVRYHLDLSLN